jgi:hypothetical protein
VPIEIPTRQVEDDQYGYNDVRTTTRVWAQLLRVERTAFEAAELKLFTGPRATERSEITA